jgi:hypothetical protein
MFGVFVTLDRVAFARKVCRVCSLSDLVSFCARVVCDIETRMLDVDVVRNS